jgi:hypothetical protein
MKPTLLIKYILKTVTILPIPSAEKQQILSPCRWWRARLLLHSRHPHRWWQKRAHLYSHISTSARQRAVNLVNFLIRPDTFAIPCSCHLMVL